MEVDLIAANPLVEETRNQIAVRRGPVVYCMESADLPKDIDLFQVAIPLKNDLKAKKANVNDAALMVLEGEGILLNDKVWDQKALYKKVEATEQERIPIKLIPYYAWNNRGVHDMSVWLPIAY